MSKDLNVNISVLHDILGLQRAMKGRNLKELEGAINFVKRNGFEITLANELIEANKILFQVITIQILKKSTLRTNMIVRKMMTNDNGRGISRLSQTNFWLRFPASTFGANQGRNLGVKTIDSSRDKKLSETSSYCPYCDDRNILAAGKLRKRN